MEGDELELPAAEVGVPVAAEVEGDVERIAGRPALFEGELRPESAASPGDAAETRGAVGVFKGEAEMAVADGARRSEEAGAAGEEEGVGVAEAEGRELLEGGEEIAGDVGEANLEVAAEGLGGGCEADAVGGDEGEAVAKLLNVVGGESEADGVGVSAEAREEGVVGLLVRGGDGVEEMEAVDGAARAVGDAVFMSENECGATGAVDDARGEDADDASMPAGGGSSGDIVRAYA